MKSHHHVIKNVIADSTTACGATEIQKKVGNNETMMLSIISRAQRSAAELVEARERCALLIIYKHYKRHDFVIAK